MGGAGTDIARKCGNHKHFRMKTIKGSKTEQNLLKAFAGESQARNRYVFFAKRARKEGYEQIAAIFDETAAQEQEHAEIFFKLLEGGKAEINEAIYPAGRIGTTAENLLAAAEGEREEWETPEISLSSSLLNLGIFMLSDSHVYWCVEFSS